MSTTLLRQPDAIAWQVPTGIQLHHPPRAERGFEHVWPEVSGTEKPTYLHPVVVETVAAAYAWFLLVFWAVFFGDGYMGLVLFVATLISCVMLGLIASGGDGGRNVAPWQRPWRSFSEFLAGEVEIWGGRISGREAFVQLAGMAWCLAALATAFGIMIALARP